MNIETKAKKISELLKQLYPEAECSLEYDNDPWRLLVMSRLAAQCTDERVNKVSVKLFEVFPDAEAMSKARNTDVEKLVFSCGLYKTKADSIIKMSRDIIERFDGKVPDNLRDLMSLPGVGSKIANLIMGDVFGEGGIVADTHCIRITNRLGLVSSKNQSIVERTLGPIVPKNEQSDFCHRIVLFGRDICRAQNPDCEHCPMGAQRLCSYKK